MQKISTILVAVALALTVVSVGTGWHLRRVAYTPPGKVIDLPLDDIDGIVIFAGDDTVAKFERQSAWRFRAPQAGILLGTVDRETLDELLSFAARAEQTPAEIDLAAAGLDDLVDLPQIVYYAGRQSRSIYLGKTAGDTRYFLAANDIETPLAMPAAWARVFSRPPAQFRAKDLFSVHTREPERLVVSGGDHDLDLRRTLDGWVIMKPFHFPAENQTVSALLQNCYLLRAADFAEKMPDAAVVATLSLQSGDDEQTVDFYRAPDGSPNDKKVFAKRRDRPEIYVVEDSLLDELTNPLLGERLRRRQLDLLNGRAVGEIRLTAADQRHITLTKSGDLWSATGDDQFSVDTAAVENLLALAARLPLVEVLPETTPLPSPTVTLQFYDAGGAMLAAIKTAPPTEAATAPQFLAQVAGRAQILVLHPLAGMTLCQPFLAYRQRLVTNFPADEITQIRIERPLDRGAVDVFRRVGTARYQRTLPVEKNLPEEHHWELLALARSLAQLQCLGYLAPNTDNEMTKYGLDRPMLKITLSFSPKIGEAEKELTLTVGPEIDAGDGKNFFYAATLTGNDYIFAVEEKLVRRLLANY
ncbi:hypothetical protein FACS1894107_15020 [Planctomycetales bacterium]|nr:hypothetical protein FACS1894107_15020 [Planctomycetales bacterium]GHT00239.1 hypothetical protein FACS1894108_11840 [Planctomycetales bacterium]